MDYSKMTKEALEAEKNRLDAIVIQTRAEMRKIRVALEPHYVAANKIGLSPKTTILNLRG